MHFSKGVFLPPALSPATSVILNKFLHPSAPWFAQLKHYVLDFPGGAVEKILRCQCRGPGFDPWSGN